jgi:hypothetical protein
MTRGTIAVDRAMAVLLALLLIAGGAATLLWGTEQVPGLDGAADLSAVTDAANKSWWPWTVGIGGAVLTLLGLRWLFAHVRRPGTDPIRLKGSDRSGRLTAEAGPVAEAAAQALALTPGVRSAQGAVIRDRGQVVARISATVDPSADLSVVAAAADKVNVQLRDVLGRDDLRCRVQLKLARRSRPLPRVH